MTLIAWPLGAVVTPPANESVTVDTPLTTVIESVVDVDVSKFDASVGVKMAVSDTDPRDAGVQEQVAVVVAALADPQPLIVAPPNRKLTAPALGTVAVMVTAPPSAASVAELGNAIVIDVDALLTVMVSDLVPTWLLPSVARTVCEYVPAGVDEEAVTVVPVSVMPVRVEPSDQV
jgi:hypothetical protein